MQHTAEREGQASGDNRAAVEGENLIVDNRGGTLNITRPT